MPPSGVKTLQHSLNREPLQTHCLVPPLAGNGAGGSRLMAEPDGKNPGNETGESCVERLRVAVARPMPPSQRLNGNGSVGPQQGPITGLRYSPAHGDG